MTFEEIRKETKAVLQEYLNRLGRYDEEGFAKKPDEYSWSISQVYAHLTGSVKYYFMPNAIKCFQQAEGQIGGEKTGAGKRIFELNGYPDTKIQQPGSLTNSAGPKAKTITQMKEVLPQLIAMLDMAQVPDGMYKPDYKVQHALLGWLNAEEWLVTNLWHWHHHKHQLGRLEAELGVTA